MSNNNQHVFSPEDFWGNILSRDADLIRPEIDRVSNDERTRIINHLQKMVSEPGWHEEQKISARYALDVILNV
jgi:hypothetical protein